MRWTRPWPCVDLSDAVVLTPSSRPLGGVARWPAVAARLGLCGPSRVWQGGSGRRCCCSRSRFSHISFFDLLVPGIVHQPLRAAARRPGRGISYVSGPAACLPPDLGLAAAVALRDSYGGRTSGRYIDRPTYSRAEAPAVPPASTTCGAGGRFGRRSLPVLAPEPAPVPSTCADRANGLGDAGAARRGDRLPFARRSTSGWKRVKVSTGTAAAGPRPRSWFVVDPTRGPASTSSRNTANPRRYRWAACPIPCC